MSILSELKSKYLGCDFRDLSNHKLKELRTKLSSITSEDLCSLQDHKDFIDLLRHFRMALTENIKLFGANYVEQLESMLSVGENGLYSNNLRFMYELIQNVDDCDYADPSNAKLSIKFDTLSKCIVLNYNEKGFTPFNVFAITGIWEAAKNISPDKVEIGEKGIGFKSVFGVASKVWIQSGKFSFELHKNNITVPIPAYEQYEEVEGTRLTLYVTNNLVEKIYRDFADDYCKMDALFNKNPLLFLNKLTSLRMYMDSFRSLQFSVERTSNTWSTDMTVEEDISIAVDLRDYRNGVDRKFRQEVSCMRYTMPIIYDRQACQSRYGSNTSLDEKKMYMHIVIPTVDSLYGDDAICKGTLYSFLPTQINLSVPIVCHVPFKLDGSREFVDPQGKNKWFTHSYESFANMVKEVLIDLAHRIKEDIVHYLPKKSGCLFESDNEKANCLKLDQFSGSVYLDLPIFHTVEKRFKRASEVFCFSEEFADPVKIYSLLGLSKELFLSEKRAKCKNLGIEVISEVGFRLFKGAMSIPELTGEILPVLSDMDSFNFVKAVQEIKECTFTVNQITAIAKCPKCARAFRDYSINKIKKYARPPYKFSHEEVLIKDVRVLDSDDDSLEASDFDEIAAAYLKLIEFKCVTISNVPDDFFFAAHNVLVLSENSIINSLSEFCRNTDKDSTFAATLKLRNASKRLDDVNSELSSGEYMKLLRSVRKSIRDVFGKKVYNNYIHIINAAGDDPDRYINELIQNADDCDYPSNVIPTFVLKTSQDGKELTTQYNENGFTKKNVRAITAIGESTKKQLISSQTNSQSEIGEKGIGFKSVFAVANMVEIHSGEFHFALTGDAPTIPNIIEKPNEDMQGTRMKFSLKKSIKADFFDEKRVFKLCLCLRKLRELQFGEFKVLIEDDGETRKIIINDKTYEFYIITYDFEVTDQEAIEERENHQRKIERKQQIRCYVPKGRNNKAWFMYSGLPTKVKINIPLVIDAPFELTTSRDGIIDNHWNNLIRNELSNALVYTIDKMRFRLGIDVLSLLRFKRNSSEPDIFSEDYLNKMKGLLKKLRKVEMFPTYQKNTFVSSGTSVKKVPNVIHYLLEQNEDIGYQLNCILRCKDKQYESTIAAFDIKEITAKETLKIIRDHYEKYINEEKFRELFYTYLLDHQNELSSCRSILRSLRIIPVKGKVRESVEFVSWNENGQDIYVRDEDDVSPPNFLLLNTNLLSKQKCEGIFGVYINELNEAVEIRRYQIKLKEKLYYDEDLELLYYYLIDQYNTNYMMLNACKDTLIANINLVPFKNECCEIRQGKMFWSEQPAGYFAGKIMATHIIHKECQNFARFINLPCISKVNFDDLDIDEPLTADDIESLQDGNICNGVEILMRCYRDGWISQELIVKYELAGFSPKSIECDVYAVLNKPVKDWDVFNKHMKDIIENPAKIEPRKVERTVLYVVPKYGNAYELNNRDRRYKAITRYSPERGYCVCQMCKKAKSNRFIEVNNIQWRPTQFWQECGVALCLECSKHYESLRENETVRKRFIEEIRKADPSSLDPIEISVGDGSITFSQMHIAELQEILQLESE